MQLRGFRRMQCSLRWLLLVLAALGSACNGPTATVDSAAVQRITQHLQALVVLGPRVGETSAAQQATTYITQQLQALQLVPTLVPIGSVELAAIEVMGTRYRAAQQITGTDSSVVVRFGPAASAATPALLFMAHYDSVPGSPGAADNAAAVGVLLELAAHLQTAPPAFPIIIAFTAREEDGLLGAEALLKALGTDIGFAIALDLIGTDGTLTLTGASTYIRQSELRYLASMAATANVTLDAPVPHRIVSRWWPQAERSDHGPFTRHGIRAVQLYHRGHDGDLVDLAYHSRFDVASRISPTRLGEISALLHTFVTAPPPGVGPRANDASDDDAGWWMPTLMGRWIAPRRLLLAAAWTLVVTALLLLFANRRVKVEPPPTMFGLAIGVITGLAAIALAYLVERFATYAGAWTLTPRFHIAATLLIIVGTTVALTRAIGRRWRWNGERRFLYAAVGIQLTLTVIALLLDAAELAPLWVGSALLLSTAPRFGRFGWLPVTAAAYPLWFTLDAARLREMVFHQFMPAGTPLALWVGFHVAPFLLGAAFLVRAHRNQQPTTSPLAAFAVPVVAICAVVVGIAGWVLKQPTCSAADFSVRNIACEMTEEKPPP